MNIWQTLKSILDNDQRVYLLTVIESLGSAPGRRGFKMVVADDGYLHGSIGGGIMEFNLVEKAKQLLAENLSQAFWIEQTHHGKSRSSSGMICSGSQIVAFTPLSPKDQAVVETCDGAQCMIEITDNGLMVVDDHHPQITTVESADKWLYRELLNRRLTVHIFGAGHVSVPTSHLLSQVGFDVCLYDNRAGLNTFEANQHVSNKSVVSYDLITEQMTVNPQDYVVLMTNKFTEDKLLLSQFLDTPCRYLGVLGSDNKIKVMFEALQKSGCDHQSLNRVSAPIGVPINSRTVEEIAISIAAEIIQVKNA